MAVAPSFDEMFTASRGTEETPERAWWWSWEEWLTLTLVALVQVPVVGSLQSSDWVREMPSLLGPAVIGLGAAWLLGQSRLPGLFAFAAALAVGVVSTVLLVMQTMELISPLTTGDGPRAYWGEFWERLHDWGAALIGGGISTDPLPFVVMLVALVFTVAFVSTWAAVRWLNPWMALIPGGFVLLTNISYLPGQPSVSFIAFILAGVLLIARIQYLRARERWRRGGTEPTEFMSLEVLTAGAAVSVVLVGAAWLVPTANHWGPVADAWGRAFAPVTERVDQLGQLFIGVGSKKALPVHSFGPTLPIQGAIALDAIPLLEVTSPTARNLRGAVYDEYTGDGWKLAAAAPSEAALPPVESAELGTPETRALVRDATKVTVTVIETGSPDQRLLSPGDPMTTDEPARFLIGSHGEVLAVVPDQRLRPDRAYASVGSSSVASVTTLQSAGVTYPAPVFERYTQLPADLPPEVAALAAEITRRAQTPYEAARAVEAFLREQYRFSLEPQAPPPRSDAAADFLFHQQIGYFDHFATAMAVMLRTQGIPTRMAVGYALDPLAYSPETRTYRVTEQQSWAWPEVYFPGLGWVEFNPTPSRGLVERPNDDRDALAERDELANPRDEFLVIPEEGADSDFYEDMIFEPDSGASSATESVAARVIGWIIIAAAAIVVAVVALRLGWERGVRGLSAPERRWAKVQRLASWAGIPTGDARTPSEAATALDRYLGEPAALAALARSFTRVRYGRPGEETAEEARARDEDYRRVSRRLWRLAARRAALAGQGAPPRQAPPVVPPLPGRHAATGPGR